MKFIANSTRLGWRDALLIVTTVCAVFCAFVAALFYIRWLGWGGGIREMLHWMRSQSVLWFLRYAILFGTPWLIIAFAVYLAMAGRSRRAGVETDIRVLTVRLALCGAFIGFALTLIFGVFSTNFLGALLIVALSAGLTCWSLVGLRYGRTG